MSYENVYIHAIDGTDCYVPIVGEFIKIKFYKLQPSKNYSPDDVTFLWSFRPGDIVKVEELSLGDGKLKRLAIQQKKPEKELATAQKAVPIIKPKYKKIAADFRLNRSINRAPTIPAQKALYVYAEIKNENSLGLI
ncbi:Uncharacterized protein AAY48_3712 [Leptospira interrogans serovar Muenchen]|nr:Uncharacterized protein AAY48_3712 [Leptospira interrogans serovar Muenchen]